MEIKDLILFLNERVAKSQSEIDKAIMRNAPKADVDLLESTYDVNLIVLLDAIEIYKAQEKDLEFFNGDHYSSIQSLIC